MSSKLEINKPKRTKFQNPLSHSQVFNSKGDETIQLFSLNIPSIESRPKSSPELQTDSSLYQWLPLINNTKPYESKSARKKSKKSLAKNAMSLLPSSYEAICLSAVLQDTIEQLSFLDLLDESDNTYLINKSDLISDDGRIQIDKIFTPDPAPLLPRKLPSHSINLVQGSRRVTFKESGRRKEVRRLLALNTELCEQGKINMERQFVQGILKDTYTELLTKNSFQTLSDAIKSERLHKRGLQEAIRDLQANQKRIRELKSNMSDLKSTLVDACDARDDMVIDLKDQLQMLKIKTSVEKSYHMKFRQNGVQQTYKKNQLDSEELMKEFQKVRQGEESELRCHNEIVSYLGSEIRRLEELREVWYTKYYRENAEKSEQLEQLKSARAKDLERMQELTKTYAEYEQVVVAHRISMERLKRQRDGEEIRLKASVRIQAWWRGIMVRKGLGPYRLKKKGKRKKEKKKKMGRKR